MSPVLPRLPAKVAVPLLCLACLVAGGAIGFVGRGASGPGEGRRDFTEVRESGYRFISPLLECETDSDVVRNRELRPFKERLEALVADRERGEGVTIVSLYFRELNDGPWFAVNKRARFVPASMRKVPMLIALLKQAERAPDLLARPVVANLTQDHTGRQNFKPSQRLEPGKTYTVGELTSRMIAQSDNNAFMLLSRVVDPEELGRVYGLLSMPAPDSAPEDVAFTVHTYASFFRILYNATYLSKDGSDLALEQLAAVEFVDGIVAGVPRDMVVAHKFGEHSDETTGERQLHDCGIVYYPGHPYVLCLMTRGRSFEALTDVIAAASRVVFEEVDAQVRADHADR